VTLGSAAGAAIDVERRAALNGAKLAGLVAARWGPGERRRGAIGASATLVAGTGAGGSPTEDVTGWVLPDGDAARALGPALAWAERHHVADLNLLADPGAAGVLARQAGLFVDGPSVWAIDGTTLGIADAAPPAEPQPAPAPTALVDLLIDAGLEIVVEGGLVRGEVNGLELARIVHGETTAREPIDQPLLEVGVGKADRELTAMVHSGMPAVEQLARVAGIVREHRRPGASRHPLNQLVPERWLRAVLCRDPRLVGLATLRPAEGARPRLDLAGRDVALAVGEDAAGDPVVVACSVGIALDLVPTAADGRLTIEACGGMHADTPPSRLVLAIPERDDHPGTRRLASRLRAPGHVVPIPGDWRAAA
jgi:hypothetical protein